MMEVVNERTLLGKMFVMMMVLPFFWVMAIVSYPFFFFAKLGRPQSEQQK